MRPSSLIGQWAKLKARMVCEKARRLVEIASIRRKRIRKRRIKTNRLRMLSRDEIRYRTDKLGIDENGKLLVYKYIDFEGGKALIQNSTFKFSKPNEFNDPFDFYDELIDFAKHIAEAPSSYTRRDRRKVEKASMKSKVSTLKQNWKQLKNDYGITCFSKTYKEILMWSHYSDKYKGICIGILIDANKFLDSHFLSFAVEYKKSFKPRPYSEKDLKERINTMIQYSTVKADFWKYEQEIRLVSYDYYKKYDSSFFNFSDFAEIKEIYFGLKIKEGDKKELKKILSIKKLKVKIYEMRLLKNKFEIDKK